LGGTCPSLALPPRILPGDLPPGLLRGWTARAAGRTSVRPPIAQTSCRWCRNLNRLSIAYALRPRLRPDSPREDQPCSGTLRHSGCRIPTCIALLIPAFSLATAPRVTHMPASPPMAMLPYRADPKTCTRGVGTVLEPPWIVRAVTHSTSELLRTLSRMAASKPTSWLSLRRDNVSHLARISGP
jgi:hypothetical protein